MTEAAQAIVNELAKMIVMREDAQKAIAKLKLQLAHTECAIDDQERIADDAQTAIDSLLGTSSAPGPMGPQGLRGEKGDPGHCICSCLTLCP